jgi:hypothetical protein
MLMFSSRLMPPINTRCKLGEFAPRVNQTPTKWRLTRGQVTAPGEPVSVETELQSSHYGTARRKGRKQTCST